MGCDGDLCPPMLCREQFFEIVKDSLQQHFKINIDKLLKHLTKSSGLIDDDIRSQIYLTTHICCLLAYILNICCSPSPHTHTPTPHTHTPHTLQRSVLWGLHDPRSRAAYL